MVPAKTSSDMEELALLRLRHRALLESSTSALVFLDAGDVVVESNQAAWRRFEMGSGHRLQDTRMAALCPELIEHLEKSGRDGWETCRHWCKLMEDGNEKAVQVTIRPLLSEENGETVRLGTIIQLGEACSQPEPQSTAERLRAVQAANEKLEAAIEELHWSNQQLAVANEEFRSLNQEMEATSGELDLLSKELVHLGERYAHTLDQLPNAVAIVGGDGKIEFWNAAAERLFSLSAAAAVGLDLCQLPLPQTIARKCRAVAERGTAVTLRNQVFHTSQAIYRLNVHLASVRPGAPAEGVLVMFLPPTFPQRVVALREPNGLVDFAAS